MSFRGLGPQLLAIFSPLGSSARLLVCSITSPSNCQGLWPLRDPDPRTFISGSGLWLPSHAQLILLWPSDLESFPERIIVNMGAGGRNGALSHLGGGKITHTPHSVETYTHAHTLTDSLDSSKREKVA